MFTNKPRNAYTIGFNNQTIQIIKNYKIIKENIKHLNYKEAQHYTKQASNQK